MTATITVIGIKIIKSVGLKSISAIIPASRMVKRTEGKRGRAFKRRAFKESMELIWQEWAVWLSG